MLESRGRDGWDFSIWGIDASIVCLQKGDEKEQLKGSEEE